MPLELPSTDPKPLSPGLYTTDAFHRQPLFEVNGRIVRSWNEAHALHGPARQGDINPAYVAALISGKPDAEAAPYKLINRLPRAHHVHVGRNGSWQTSAYDPLSGGASSMEADALHQFLQQGLIDHLKQTLKGHPGAIGCEHSSGLDSNAILGGLIHGLGVDPERIHTWSNEGCGEGNYLLNFRAYHRLKPSQCHRFEATDDGNNHGLLSLKLQLKVLGAPAQIGDNPQSLALMRQHGCTVLFSGFGGDQALSHNAANVPTDLVTQRRWRELAKWLGSKRRFLRQILILSLMISNRQLTETVLRRRTRNIFSSGLLRRTLTPNGHKWLGPHLNERLAWEFDSYLNQHASIYRRVLADWVAVRVEDESRLASFYGITKAFPLLDEKLIGSLLQQDPILFGEGAGRGRLIHRRAFAPFLPPFLRTNPSKARTTQEDLKSWRTEMNKKRRKALERSIQSTTDWHPNIFRYWDVHAIQNEIDAILSSQEPNFNLVTITCKEIDNMTAISDWWHALDD